MARVFRIAIFMACFLSGGSAYAAGGACPTGGNYINSASPLTLVTLSSLGITNCYYISAAGADTNSGTTEASPWLHSPGMQNCAGNCAAVSVTGGEGFIFRGGDTWHFGNSSLSPYAGVVSACDFNKSSSAGLCFGNAAFTGSSSSPVYVGVDLTWYSGSSWARPIFTGDNPLTPHPGVFADSVASCAYQMGSNNKIVSFEGSTYGILDNFELTGLCSKSTTTSNDVYVEEAGPLTTNNSYERLYIHGWTHIPYTGGYVNNIILFSGTNLNGLGDSHLLNVVDGSDSDPGGIEFVKYGGAYNDAYNVFRYASNYVVTSTHLIHDNLFEYWYGEGDEQHHPNLYEENGEYSATNAVYNNVFLHICQLNGSGSNCPVGMVGIWPEPSVGFTTYFFNNVFGDVNGSEVSGNYFNIGQNANSGNQGTLIIFNNTFQMTGGAVGILDCQSTYAHTFTAANNHYIVDLSSQYSSPCSGGTFVSDGPLMSNATATADGYTASQTYAYSPTLSSSPTVGHGTNEQAFCTALSTAGLSTAATACQSSTTYACGYNSSNHAVSCPAQSAVARPASAAWDEGAYQFSGVQTPAPNPPTSLKVSVQ